MVSWSPGCGIPSAQRITRVPDTPTLWQLAFTLLDLGHEPQGFLGLRHLPRFLAEARRFQTLRGSSATNGCFPSCANCHPNTGRSGPS
ncbi:MAG: hypothetical protein ACK587_14565 [Cyanobacteriota bacterium]